MNLVRLRDLGMSKISATVSDFMRHVLYLILFVCTAFGIHYLIEGIGSL